MLLTLFYSWGCSDWRNQNKIPKSHGKFWNGQEWNADLHVNELLKAHVLLGSILKEACWQNFLLQNKLFNSWIVGYKTFKSGMKTYTGIWKQILTDRTTFFYFFCSFLGITIEKLNWHCSLQHLSLLFFLLQGPAEFTGPAITYKQTYRSTYLNSINSTCYFSSGLLVFSFAKSLLIIATYLRQSEMSATKQT